MSDNITDIDTAQMTPNDLTAFMKIVVETFREYPPVVGESLVQRNSD